MLYEQGFTISGARNRLSETPQPRNLEPSPIDGLDVEVTELDLADGIESLSIDVPAPPAPEPELTESTESTEVSLTQMRQELLSIRGLLTV